MIAVPISKRKAGGVSGRLYRSIFFTLASIFIFSLSLEAYAEESKTVSTQFDSTTSGGEFDFVLPWFYGAGGGS